MITMMMMAKPGLCSIIEVVKGSSDAPIPDFHTNISIILYILCTNISIIIRDLATLQILTRSSVHEKFYPLWKI